MGYLVLIDDNFHHQDESERVKHGVFATPEEAPGFGRPFDTNSTATFLDGPCRCAWWISVNPGVGRDRPGLKIDGFGLADFGLPDLGLPDRFLCGRFSPFPTILLPVSRSCLKA
jgi:hypothetical protein